MAVAYEAHHLYSERKKLADKKHDLVTRATAKAIRPGLLARIATKVEEVSPGTYSEDELARKTLGKGLSRKIARNQEALEDIRQRAANHYQANQDEYHQLAVVEAQAAGKSIDFDGQVAVNVQKDRSTAELPSHPSRPPSVQ